MDHQALSEFKSVNSVLQKISTKFTTWTGTSAAFLLALTSVFVWAITGPVFHFSDSWQLVMNTTSSIVTFIMVFLIQRSQNKDALAIQLKLNEIVASIQGASNKLINVEKLSEEELNTLHERYRKLAEIVGSSRTVVSDKVDELPENSSSQA